MSVTIKDIAALAGVSTGTVDRVINNRGNVSPKVETRIRKIIKEVGYAPNLMAKSLSLKRCSPKIGVVFHVSKLVFIEEVAKGIQAAMKELSDFGVKVLMRYSHSFDVDNQIEIIDDLLREGVNAIAISPLNSPRIVDRIDQLLVAHFPVFCFINEIITKNPHVFIGPNAFKTGELAAGLFSLISGGEEEHLAVVTPSLKTLGHIQKIEGLHSALEMRYPNITLMDICEIPVGNDVDVYIDVHKAINQYLDRHPQITAMWYATSMSNGGIISVVEHNLLHKLKIVAIDIQPFIIKGLEQRYIQATISQNPYEQGYKTIKTIFNSLLLNQYSKSMSVETPCEILIRESLDEKMLRCEYDEL